jgi:hypothetical protein
MREESPAQCATGGFADLADYIHFGDIRERFRLPQRDRSLTTVANG